MDFGVIEMTIRTILIVLTLFLFQTAYAQQKTIEHAVETAPSNIEFPSTESGTVVFKPCSEECDVEKVRVSLGLTTEYLVEGKPAKFEDFRKKFFLIKHSRGSYALVRYDTKTKIVTSINISG